MVKEHSDVALFPGLVVSKVTLVPLLGLVLIVSGRGYDPETKPEILKNNTPVGKGSIHPSIDPTYRL